MAELKQTEGYDESSSRYRMRRLRLRIDGQTKDPRFKYRLQVDLSGVSRSLILVERESQKGIIIGHNGGALKKIGSKARIALEKFFGKKIFIELHVKVSKNWRSNSNQLRKFGYKN